MLHVACAAQGEAYVAHSAAMLHSVLEHGDVHVHYLHGPVFDAAWRDGLRAVAGDAITFHRIGDEAVAGLPGTWPFTVAMWYRIFLPRLLPGVDRALYLDVDTIVLDALAPLEQLDLGDAYLAAVTNVFEPHFAHRPAALGLSGPEAYFNSGVLLLNLDAMRADDCTQRLLDYARREAPHLQWPDQDALNVVLGGRRLALAPRWNSMNSLAFEQSVAVFGAEAVAEARDRPAIRHFEGPAENKPWHYLCERDLRDAYLRHRRATPWPEVDLIGFTRANRVRRAARGVRRRLSLSA